VYGIIDSAPAAGDVSPVAFREPEVTIVDAGELPAKLQLRFAAWLRVSGQFDSAADMLEAIERQFGETAALLDEQAALALANGDVSQTRLRWQQRLASFPAPSARAAFGRALLELGELDEAAEIAGELQAEHGELAPVRSLAADVALQQGDLATAHDHWQAQLA
jgi:tetratricopeptide (TPR) repeat protein